MADLGRSGGLRTIFSIFLGLMLTAFVGVGVYTFHPPPDQFETQIRDLGRREQELRDSRGPDVLTHSDREQLREINNQRAELIDAAEEARKPWGLSTSIILIVFATVSMAVSLVRADQLPVISNGLLLGGVFTMLYGIGWIVATDTSISRFVVITVALAVTLGLGYVRFVRRGTTGPEKAGSAISEDEGVTEIERRVRNLEERLDEAAQALGSSKGNSSTL